MDPHVAEALKTMSKKITDFSATSQPAISGLASKIDTLPGTVTTMQEQLNQQAEAINDLITTVDNTSNTSKIECHQDLKSSEGLCGQGTQDRRQESRRR